MGRAPCCDKIGLKRGPWSEEEDQLLINHINQNGHRNWRALPKKAGLLRCGKSCRLRWINYLRPDIKRGDFTKEEENAIIQLHQELGNKWSAIASRLPGRTDNEIKNVWNTRLKKRLDGYPPKGTRKRSSRVSKSKKADTIEKSVKKNSASKGNNDNADAGDPQKDIIMDEKTSTSVNSSTSSCISTIDNDTLEHIAEVDDDFWTSMENAYHLPQVNDVGIHVPRHYLWLPSSSAMDGFEYGFEMDFWCNYLTRDEGLQELVSNM